MDRTILVNELSSIVDPTLAKEVVASFEEMEKRFVIRDLKPTGLEGGRFCEAVARSLYQIDSGTFNPNKSVSSIVDYLIDEDGSRTHQLQVKDRKHFAKVLSTAYKFRSDRGVIHISDKYEVNELDATFLIGCIRWLFSEFLRLCWNSDRDALAETIKSIVEIKFPAIHVHDQEPLVLNDSVTCIEEILLLLNWSHNGVLEKSAIHKFVHKSPPSISKGLSVLKQKRYIREKDNLMIITPSGTKFVLNNLAKKLTL